MENLGVGSGDYLKKLSERSKTSRVYQPYQLIGLRLAELLDDEEHRSLYMKLAKNHDHSHLLGLAQRIAEKEEIKNKGAYFMRVFFSKS